jgi:uncharacterized protein YeaO (DUF488 family)
MIRLKRVYELAAQEDGTRLFVERLWPRGVKIPSLRLDAWVKGVAPSSALCSLPLRRSDLDNDVARPAVMLAGASVSRRPGHRLL